MKKQCMIVAFCSAPLIFGMQADGAMSCKESDSQKQLKNIYHDLCNFYEEVGSKNFNNMGKGDRQQVLKALFALQNTQTFLSLPQQEQIALRDKRCALYDRETSPK